MRRTLVSNTGRNCRRSFFVSNGSSAVCCAAAKSGLLALSSVSHSWRSSNPSPAIYELPRKPRFFDLDSVFHHSEHFTNAIGCMEAPLMSG